MKVIKPQEEDVIAQRSFLIYGEPKAGKTSLAMSLAKLGKTVFIAAESDGWQDAYHELDEDAQKNLTVVELESLQDLKDLPAKIKSTADAQAVVVDSYTAIMEFIEREIKKRGGKGVIGGLTEKLALQSYGDLANLAMQFLKGLKASGKHVVLTAGLSKDKNDTGGEITSRAEPLMTGSKTAQQVPYEVRAIGFLRLVNGKRELWFESSQSWMAGTNYSALTKQRVVEDPDFKKIFSLFPKPKKNDKKKEESKDSPDKSE